MTIQLVTILILNIFIAAAEILAYSARLAGVRTGRPIQARSIYNLIALSARAANALQTTLLAGLVDRATIDDQTNDLTLTMRWILLAMAIGIGIGAALVPSGARLLVRAIQSYTERQSLPRVIIHGLGIEGLPKALEELHGPRIGAILWASHHRLPWRWVLITVAVAALYAVAAPAAQIASATTPQCTRTALTLPAFFTGLGAILMALLVDPLTAHIVDQALCKERPQADVTAVTVWQIGGRLTGVLLAQPLLSPSAALLEMIAAWLV
jgi:hypothetical protein